MIEPGKSYYSTTEVARLLNVDRHTIVNLVKRRRLPAVWIGSCIRIHPDELEEFLKKNYVRR